MLHVGWFNSLRHSRLQQILNTAQSMNQDRVSQHKQIKSDLQQSRAVSQNSGPDPFEVRIRRIVEDNHDSNGQVMEGLRSRQPDLVRCTSVSLNLSLTYQFLLQTRRTYLNPTTLVRVNVSESKSFSGTIKTYRTSIEIP